MNRNDRIGLQRTGLQRTGFQGFGFQRIRSLQIRYQRPALLFVVLAFVLAVWPLGILGLSGGVWQEAGRSAYVETFRALHAAVSLPPERLP